MSEKDHHWLINNARNSYTYMPKPPTYTCKILKKEALTDDVICLHLEKPAGLNYKPGQFAQFQLPNPAKPGAFIPRPYSIASIPTDPKLKFYIKLVPNGQAKPFLAGLKADDPVKIMAPLGRFNLAASDCPSIFVAAGVGIAPIIALIRELLAVSRTAQPVNLLFGVRGEKDIFLIQELAALQKKYNNFSFTLTLSRPESAWPGARGRVTTHLDNRIDQNAHYYLCGNLPMITDVRKILEERGIAKNKVHFEIF